MFKGPDIGHKPGALQPTQYHEVEECNQIRMAERRDLILRRWNDV